MTKRIGKVWPALALAFVMAESGAALTQFTPPLAVTSPVIGVAANQRLKAQPRHVAVLEQEEAVAEIRPIPPAGLAKNYALALSSIGMLSVISLLRLSRSF